MAHQQKLLNWKVNCDPFWIGLFPLQEHKGNFTGPWPLLCVSVAGTTPEGQSTRTFTGYSIISKYPRNTNTANRNAAPSIYISLLSLFLMCCLSEISQNWKWLCIAGNSCGMMSSPESGWSFKIPLCNVDTAVERTQWGDVSVKFLPLKFSPELPGNGTRDSLRMSSSRWRCVSNKSRIWTHCSGYTYWFPSMNFTKSTEHYWLKGEKGSLSLYDQFDIGCDGIPLTIYLSPVVEFLPPIPVAYCI